MVFIDHLVSYITEGGEFIEVTVESATLGFVSIITALIVWEIALLIKDPKQIIRRKI
mgnify:CR=1 FL=1